jgi:predicted nucleic acid-binding protein
MTAICWRNMAAKVHVLVDLNVVMDVLQERRPHYEESARVLDVVVRQEAAGYLAAHSLTTLFYVLSRLRDRKTAVAALTTLLESFTVANVDDSVIRQALSWGWADFEDAVQMAAAANARVDYLVTQNPRDFQPGPLPVVQPAALLAILPPWPAS